jgi:hypothetical protein
MVEGSGEDLVVGDPHTEGLGSAGSSDPRARLPIKGEDDPNDRASLRGLHQSRKGRRVNAGLSGEITWGRLP